MFDNIWLWIVQYFEKLDTKQIVSNWNENACVIKFLLMGSLAEILLFRPSVKIFADKCLKCSNACKYCTTLWNFVKHCFHVWHNTKETNISNIDTWKISATIFLHPTFYNFHFPERVISERSVRVQINFPKRTCNKLLVFINTHRGCKLTLNRFCLISREMC